MNSHRLLRLFCLAILITGLISACGGDRSRGDRGGGGSVIIVDYADVYGDADNNGLNDTGPIGPIETDVGPEDTPSTPTCQGCTTNQVCVSGVCEDIPTSCPCPSETYCNLADDTCVVGCIDDTNCAANRICNSEQRECRDGCRLDEECGAGRICNDITFVCQTGCRSDDQCAADQICEELLCRTGCRDNDACSGALVCDLTQELCRASAFAHMGAYMTGGDSEWREITTDDGFAALESGPVPDDGISWVEFQLNIDEPKILAFDWTVSSRDSFSTGLKFCRNVECNFIHSIQGPMFTREDGVLTNITWESIEVEYEAGSHPLVWKYERDSWGARYEDRGWVKNIRILDIDETPGTEISVTNSQSRNIPDNNATGVTSFVEVTDTGVVSEVRVDVDITHPYRGDLTLYLVHDGQTREVYNPTGSTNDVLLEDHAVSGFAGVSAQGTWGLRVVDSASGDLGRINSWTLKLVLE
ncbi:MAG: proprotein convertase P-domain-containing protein [Bradymonadaceae bacterium]